MSGWRRVNLRRVAKLGTGHTPSRQHPEYWVNCTIPWLTLADVWQLRDETRQIIFDTKEKISEVGLANSSAVLHSAGTVVMSRTASVGFSCILGTDMATSQDFATWTCGPALRPRYLLYALRGLRNEILGMRMGSTHQTIYMPDIERISVPLPSVETQDAIAGSLDVETARIDALIAKKNHLIKLLEDKLDSIRESTFVQQPEVRMIPLMHLTNPYRPIVYGIVQAGPEVVDGIPYIKSGDLPGLDVSTLSRTSREIHDQYRRASVFPGDIVMAMRASIGAAAVVPPDLTLANLTQGTARIAAADDINIRWLFHVLHTRAVREQCNVRAVGTTFRTLNIWDLRRVHIPAVPKENQERLARKFDLELDRHDAMSAKLKEQTRLLREHRQALITAAVMGELEVSGRASVDA